MREETICVELTRDQVDKIMTMLDGYRHVFNFIHNDFKNSKYIDNAISEFADKFPEDWM